MTAAVGVILDPNTNTQKFFGGGKCENASKQVSSDKLSHNNDITAITISKNRTLAVTG